MIYKLLQYIVLSSWPFFFMPILQINRFQRNWGMDPSFMPSRKSFERAGTELIFLINIKEIEREREIYILFIH